MRPNPAFGLNFLSYLFLLVLAGVANAREEGLRDRLERLREQDNPIVQGVPLASARLLDEFYRGRDYRYAWHDNRQVQHLLRLAEGSLSEGLQPSDFHAQEIREAIGSSALSDLSASSRVDADLLMSNGLLRLVHHQRYGKVDPNRLGNQWYYMEGAAAADLVHDLEKVVSADDLQAEVAGLVSRPAFYKRLAEGLARYREIAAAGGWSEVPTGRPLKPGMSDARIPLVRERLRVTGDYRGPASDNRKYDRELEAAVRVFQKRHHLGIDAVVGPATLASMNVTAEERVNQIRVNLERMRWVYDQLPGDFLLVDITGQEVQFFRDEKVVWTSRVIVGRPERPTPVFRDQMEYLEINPRWTVPPTILKKDILPAMRKNPGYLKKKGLQVVTRDGQLVSPGAVNWQASAATFPYLIRQPPGERNALGQIKFMFPNRFSVYLHDTPKRSLFAEPRRLYSSGCVRVAKPWELAELVLNDPKHWSQAKLKEVVASNRTRWVTLKKPLTVILAYWTAEADEDGTIEFREDVYTRDDAVLSALDANGPIRIQFAEPTQPGPGNVTQPVDLNASSPLSDPKASFDWSPRQGALAQG